MKSSEVPRSVAFTGHRPESLPFGNDESAPSCQALKDKLYRAIVRIAKLGPATFYCGMAQGVDIICGELVVAAQKQYPHIDLCCVLPYRNHGQRWPAAWRNRHNALLEAANWIDCLSEVSRRDCYHRRNRYLVESAETLIAVYDGRETGGTAYTVQYARRWNRYVIVIDPGA